MCSIDQTCCCGGKVPTFDLSCWGTNYLEGLQVRRNWNLEIPKVCVLPPISWILFPDFQSYPDRYEFQSVAVVIFLAPVRLQQKTIRCRRWKFSNKFDLVANYFAAQRMNHRKKQANLQRRVSDCSAIPFLASMYGIRSIFPEFKYSLNWLQKIQNCTSEIRRGYGNRNTFVFKQLKLILKVFSLRSFSFAL